MPTLRSINLIKTKTSSSPRLEFLESVLGRASTIGLTFLIFSGLLVGSLFFYLTLTQSQLLKTKETFSDYIVRDTTKEALLLAIKERAKVVGVVMAKERPLGEFFEIVAGVFPASILVSIALDDHDKAVVIVQARTIEEVVSVADSLVLNMNEGKVKDPQLLSLGFGRDGSIEVSFSFVPIL